MDNIPEYDGIGIYALVDESGKMYIGSSIKVRSRLRQHFASLKNGSERNSRLVSAFNNGVKFQCEILEKIPYGCDTYHLIERERFYIFEHDTLHNGYNVAIPNCAVPKNIDDYPFYKGSESALQRHAKLSAPILEPVKTTKPIKEKISPFKLQLQGEEQRYKRAAASAGLSIAQFFINAAEEKIARENLL